MEGVVSTKFQEEVHSFSASENLQMVLKCKQPIQSIYSIIGVSQVIRKSKTKVSLVKFAIKFSGKEGWQAVRPQQEKVRPQDQEYE